MQFLVLDTETVGFNVPKPPASGVVQIAWTPLDPDNPVREPVQCFNTNPGCDINPKASQVHGLYAEDVKDCPELGDVFHVSEPVVIIGHNISFDLRFVSPYLDNFVGSLCTYEMAKRYVRKSRNHKLTTLTEEFELEQGKAHDAGGDVFSTVSLLLYLCAETGMTPRQMYEKHKLPMVYDVMPFGKHKGKSFSDIPNSYIRWYLDLEPESQDRSLRMTFNQEMARRQAA